MTAVRASPLDNDRLKGSGPKGYDKGDEFDNRQARR